MSQSTRNNRTNFGVILFAAITIPVAIITLLGLAPLPLLPDMSLVSQGIIQIITVVGAVAVIVGVLNLIAVHLRKFARFEGISAFYSAITLITLISVVSLHVLEVRGVIKLTSSSNEPVLTLTLMDATQVVIESALAGMMFFFLVYAAYRLMRRRVTVWGVIFITTLVLVLIGYVQPPGSLLNTVSRWVLRVPVAAGTRGLLIGIALGTITVGVRVLIGQDRLFRE